MCFSISTYPPVKSWSQFPFLHLLFQKLSLPSVPPQHLDVTRLLQVLRQVNLHFSSHIFWCFWPWHMNATEINKRMEVYPSMVQSLNRSDPGLTISLFISAANITNHYRNTPMLGPYCTSTPTIYYPNYRPRVKITRRSTRTVINWEVTLIV